MTAINSIAGEYHSTTGFCVTPEPRVLGHIEAGAHLGYPTQASELTYEGIDSAVGNDPFVLSTLIDLPTPD